MSRMVFVLALAGLLSACQPTPENFGFSLPKGDAENGKILFAEFQCYECHTFSDVEFNDDQWRLTEGEGIAIELGGEKVYKQTYADLVTSVINPSHRIAKGYADQETTYEDGASKMAYYNSYMTVEELIDIVTFLETKYTVGNKPYTPYNPYTVIAPL
jgi:sulfur-oxidizing protein SoxX